ncbi:MAG: helical backbone metal receptor [Flavobacteriaceae bacterium]|nr:helical backbone metal receptor [Flavobacteriaceae bacterium]
MQIRDQLHSTLIFNQVPRRIISLVPSQTELLVSLGLANTLVGITKFCVHPEDLRKKKTIVGGTKNVNFEKIKDLKPDIIICNKEENSQEIVETCEKIAAVYVSDIITLQDNFEFIRAMGVIFSVETKAKKLLNDLQSELHQFKTFIKKRPQRRVAYFIWRDPWMVAGNNTFINELLKINKFKNVFDSQERYPLTDLEHLKSLGLDLILLSSEPYPFKEKHSNEIRPYTNAKICLVNGEYFSWYGSRLLKAFEYFISLH